MIEDIFFCLICKWLQIILMVSVRVPVSVHMAECEKVCQHFGLIYSVRTALQASRTWKMPKEAAKFWGDVWHLVK